MSFTVAPIVEGHGDVAALPLLIRRINPALGVARPVRFPRNRLVEDEHLKRAAQIAASNITDNGAVLLVIDADEDCAATFGPHLQNRLNKMLPQCLCRVVLAVHEFEAWIVGGHTVFDATDPDHVGGLKDRIRHQFGVYKETIDQPRLIASADLVHLAQCSRSFRRMKSVIDELTGLA